MRHRAVCYKAVSMLACSNMACLLVHAQHLIESCTPQEGRDMRVNEQVGDTQHMRVPLLLYRHHVDAQP